MRIAIGADWVGFEHKQALAGFLRELGHDVTDMGPASSEPCDYVDFAEKVARAVARGEARRGVLICGTGIGMSIAANKVKGARAALCHDAFTVARSRQHNDANILAMGAWVVSLPHATELVDLWLKTDYEGGRHVARLEKITRLEMDAQGPPADRIGSPAAPLKKCMALTPTPANFAPLLFAGDLRRGMERAAALGYDGVELNLRDSEQLDQEAIAAWARDLGLEVPSFGTGQSYFTDGLSLADPEPAVQRAVRERMRGHIRFAARLGARVVLGSVRGDLKGESEVELQAGRTVAVEAARELAGYAADLGVSLIVEPINRYETKFLNTIDETLEFIDTVGAPNVGIVADTFHMNIEEASLAEALGRAGDRLWHVHLVDSNRCAPGMGHTDFEPVLAALRQMGYDGYLSAEILPRPDDETAAQRWMEQVCRLTSA